jgi:hypothetical protein
VKAIKRRQNLWFVTTAFKGGIRRKQKKAALDESYLAAILAV